jgi:ribosomal-protein-alanine N-acetyltransferase
MGSPAPQGQIEFRPLMVNDLAFVSEIENGAYSEPWSDQLLLESLGAPMTHSFGLFCGSELLAYAIFQVVLEEGHLLNLAVHPKHQSKGYGGMILEKMLQKAYDEGARRVFLEVRPSNERALELYRKRGFLTLKRRENYYANGEAALVLYCDL